MGITAANLDSLHACDIEIEFDAGLVDFAGAAPGAAFDGHDVTFACEDGGSSAHIVCALTEIGACVPAAGHLLDLRFAALDAEGESPLHLAATEIRDCADRPIAALRGIDGRMVVGAVATLFFDPDPKYVAGARPFEISLEIDALDSLRAFQAFLSFDENMIDFDSAYVGDIWIDPLWWYVTREGPGRIRIESVILGPDLFVHGPGQLSRLQFQAVMDSGQTLLEFDTWHVWDVEADEFLPVAADDGLIIIDWHLQPAPEDASTRLPPRLELAPARGNPGSHPTFLCRLAHQPPPRAFIHDIAGRIVCELIARPAAGESLAFDWDGRDARGHRAAPGVYLMRLSSGFDAATRKVVLMR